ncbi:MAG: fructosamine kinase [Deltaproteobacteria bacterium]|nr:MAG: fructosamine kinase [Deltaproteobacteria bacterium]
MYSDQIRTTIETHLDEKIEHSSMLGGGSIASTWKLDGEKGRSFVLKINPNRAMVVAETQGLKELSKSGEIRVPKVFLYKDDWLLMEHISQGKKDEAFFTTFGAQLAKMHRHECGSYGFEEDNFIGETPQINLEHRHSWVDFFLQNRLVYQIERALSKGAPHKLKDNFLRALPTIRQLLEESTERPCLLHGDLWSGNYLVDKEQLPVLIDPAVYYGHREAELAMTRLFGGFDPSFYEAYEQEYPLQAGHQNRLPLYELYHVLNHYNLFGGHYLDQSLEILAKYF